MKRIMYITVFIIVSLLATSFFVLSQSKFGQLPRGERLEKIKHSPNFQDGKFKNQSVTPLMTDSTSKFKSLIHFLFRNTDILKPTDSIPFVKTNLKVLDSKSNILIWFGHSSYFMQIDGKKILVDPVFSGYASPFSWMVKAFNGSNYYKAEDIPDVDYLIITHDHWDHLDYETVTKLKSRIRKIICGLGVGSHFEYWGFNPNSIIELDWWEHSSLDSGWVISATPARHFSGRGLKANQTLWASFVLQTPTLKLFLGGDGGYDKHFAEIGSKFGPFDMAIMEQGQYDQRWKYIHMLPEQVFKAAKDLKTKRLMPVHNSKFLLGNHKWNAPLNLLKSNGIKFNIPVITPMIGEQVNLNDTSQFFSQWWLGLK